MFGSGRTSPVEYELQTLSPRGKEDVEVRRQLFRISATLVVGLVAIGILVYLVLRGVQPKTASVAALRALEGTFTCEEASSRVRDAIDYGQDPCEDFYAYACSKHGHQAAAEARYVAAQKIRDALVALAKTDGDTDACRQVALFHQSCLVAASSPVVDLGENARILFDVIKRTLRQVPTVLEIIDFAAELSLSRGVSAFMSFVFSRAGSLTLSFNNPFSGYSSNDSLRSLLSSWLLDLPQNETEFHVQNLITLDWKLNAVSRGPRYLRDVSLSKLVYLMGGKLSPEELVRIFNSYRPPRLKPLTSESIISIPGVKLTKKVLSVLFQTAHLDQSAEYLLLHALLPQSLLQLYRSPRDGAACLDLTRRNFLSVWDDLTAYLLALNDRSGDARVMIANLTIALNKLLSRKHLFATSEDVAAATGKLEGIRLELPKPDTVRVQKSLKGLGRMNASSLYRNILELGRFAAQETTADDQTQAPAKRPTNGHRTLRVHREVLRPPFYCHGPYNFLNYATLGVASAEALLGVLGGPFAGHNASHEDYSPPTGAQIGAIRGCLSLSVDKMAAGVAAQDTWLRELVLSVGAFQLALEASVSTERGVPDQPAMEQTFFARYCQSLCALDGSGPVEAPANVRCNVAVMNSPRFATLFGCLSEDPMTPNRYCSVL